MTDPALASTLIQAPESGPTKSAARTITGKERYLRLGVIGEGGMGRVERVRDQDLHRDVALKHLQPQFRESADLVAQFLWEARVTAYLDHPNIVPVHDLGRAVDGEPFFAMKLIRGESLESTIARWRAAPSVESAASIPKRLRLFLQLTHAVSYAHSHGVLHRDLKPANVMVGEFGEVLVTDWGLALPAPDPSGDGVRQIAPDGLATLSAGTPSYMAPEQIRGESLDARADIYSLGVILYELIALRHPIDASNVADVLAAASKGEIVPLTRAAPGVTRSIAAVVAKAMACNRDVRYRTASELAADVELVIDGRTPAAEDASYLTMATRFYFGRERAFASLRPVDLDVWVLSGMFFGAGLGARFVAKLPAAWWIAILLGIAVAVPPTTRWIRTMRRMRDTAKH
jgi:serine/threonine-protein kinase